MNINQITVLLLLVCVVLSGCVGQTQEEEKVYRVGILSGLDVMYNISDGFRAGMTQLGYIEGENIVYDLHMSDFDIANYKNVVQKFVEDKVDLIFVFPTEASITAKEVSEGTGIPVVFAFSVVEGTNLVESVRQPGGHITGVRDATIDVTVKRLETFKEIVPDAELVWIAYQKNNPTIPPQLEVLRPAASSMGITLVEVPAESIEDVQADLDARSASDDIGIDAIMLIAEPLMTNPDNLKVAGEFAKKHKVPVGGFLLDPEFIVFGYENDLIEIGELAASSADKILRGTPAGTIPVITPESKLAISYKAAQGFGLTIPQGLLNKASEIIR